MDRWMIGCMADWMEALPKRSEVFAASFRIISFTRAALKKLFLFQLKVLRDDRKK